ncbi:MAG: CidA/LrgA family protein [Rhodospirillaceae bacterium]|nr:CidA/LrgA family protein [Rhodospirillaceae bacterium]
MAIVKVNCTMTLGFITVLLVYQLVGEVISAGLDLPLPGPVVGMGLLFLSLIIKGGLPEGLKNTAKGLLSHLSLLFVPAGVGVMMHLHLLASEWQAITIALIGSTVLTILVTAGVMIGLTRLTGDSPSAEEIKND